MIKNWVVRVRPGEPRRNGLPEAFGDQQLAGTDSYHPVLIAPQSGVGTFAHPAEQPAAVSPSRLGTTTPGYSRAAKARCGSRVQARWAASRPEEGMCLAASNLAETP